MAYHLNI